MNSGILFNFEIFYSTLLTGLLKIVIQFCYPFNSLIKQGFHFCNYNFLISIYKFRFLIIKSLFIRLMKEIEIHWNVDYGNYFFVCYRFNIYFQSSRPAIERPGLESQRSRKRHFFHRKIFKFFKILNLFALFAI